MRTLIPILFLTLTWFVGCKEKPVPSADYIILDEITYVGKFPETISISNGESVELDVIGTNSIRIEDSLLIVSTSNPEGFWSFFSIPDHIHMGDYLLKGNGPKEVLSAPWVADEYFYKEQYCLFSKIYDFSSGRMLQMNVTETLANRFTDITQLNPLPRTLFNMLILSEDSYFCQAPSDDHCQQTRFLQIDGKRETSENLEKLNLASVKKGKNINIISAHMDAGNNGSRIAEAYLYLNQINLYSLDDSFGKTICLGERVQNIAKIEDTKSPERMFFYCTQVAYDNFFSALYINDTNYNYETGNSKTPVIHFFDWDGNPLLEVKLDRDITGYDIDFLNGKLYTSNYKTEEIFLYEITEVLDLLKTNH